MIQKFYFFILLKVIYISADLKADGENVCLKTEKFTETVYVDKLVPTSTYETHWCWNPGKGFRCVESKQSYKIVKEPKVVDRWRFILRCCAGYKEDKNNSKCIPLCLTTCTNGQCIAPDTCFCYTGFYGLNCDKLCPPGRWGRNCSEVCDCFNQAKCELVNGNCICQSGWHGLRCELPCPTGFYGPQCREQCKCPDEQTCNPETGICEHHIFISKKKSIVQSSNELVVATTRVSLQYIPTQQEYQESGFNTITQEINANMSDEDFDASDTTSLVKTTTEKENEYSRITTEILFIKSTSKNYRKNKKNTLNSTWGPDNLSTTVTNVMLTGDNKNLNNFPQPETTKIEFTDTEKNYVTVSTSIFSTSTEETTFTDEAVYVTKNNWTNPENNKIFSTTDHLNFTVESDLPRGETFATKKLHNQISSTSGSSILLVKIPTDDGFIENNGTNSDFEGRKKESFFRNFRFIPSVSVLSGVAIIIIIIGARWLTHQNRINTKKLSLRKREEILNMRHQQKYQESFLMVKKFSNNLLHSYEAELKEGKPTLQTFKPSF